MIARRPANKLRPLHPLGSKTIRLLPDSEARLATALPSLSIKERHGLNALLCCTCGATLELDYSTPHMRTRVDAFCDAHEDCPTDIAKEQLL